jgi:hypothetical protein
VLGPAPFLGATSALIELKIASRHHRRYRVLVDELRKAFPDKQNGEPVERRDETLKLHAIHEEYRQRHPLVAQLHKECVLQFWRMFFCHRLSGEALAQVRCDASEEELAGR